MSIGSRILEARTKLDLTQESLAAKIGVTKSAIANYENGVSTPRIEIMFKLFEALNRDANFFYQDDMPSISPSSEPFDVTILRAFHAADAVTQRNVCKLLDIDCSDVYAPLREALDRKIDEIEGSSDQRKA